MKVFISQSKPRGQALAEALRDFVRQVVAGTEPWVSSKELDKGSLFRSEIQANLTEAFGGIVCLTSESRDERWLLYEAGAISVRGRVWTVLLDLEKTDVLPPLGDFHHTRATEKADMWELIQVIHSATVAAGNSKQQVGDVETI